MLLGARKIEDSLAKWTDGKAMKREYRAIRLGIILLQIYIGA